MVKNRSQYDNLLQEQFADYYDEHFSDRKEVFDTRYKKDAKRPSVFAHEYGDLNVLSQNDTTNSVKEDLLNKLPKHKRHRWFGSMKSSQALAQSVFGNLAVYQKHGLISMLRSDYGAPLFCDSDSRTVSIELEHAVPVEKFNESVSTEIDVFITHSRVTAVECKFSEREIGPCTRPRAKKCTGNYDPQTLTGERCYLTDKGIRYWDFVPELFMLQSGRDYSPCPIAECYQLVRNILAVAVTEDSTVNPNVGHAVLVYDDRNPDFWESGKGMRAWKNCKELLKYPNLLQKCSWQEIARAVSVDSELDWLATSLREKYGIA